MNVIKRGLLLGLVTGAACFGATIAITNPSFESPALATGGFTVDNVTGWTVTGTAGAWAPTAGIFASIPDGTQVLYEGTGTSDANQTLGVSLLANTTYTLTFYVGHRTDFPLSAYTVSLDAGATVLASDTAGAPAAGTFVQRTISYTTGASPISGILTIDIASSGSVGQTAFDAFSLTTAAANPIPEPASMLLFGGGLLCVALVGRRKFARK